MTVAISPKLTGFPWPGFDTVFMSPSATGSAEVVEKSGLVGFRDLMACLCCSTLAGWKASTTGEAKNSKAKAAVCRMEIIISFFAATVVGSTVFVVVVVL
mgnify:CR=1 FL=1